MDQELLTILSEIEASIAQAKAMAAGDASVEAPVEEPAEEDALMQKIMEAMKQMEGGEEEDKKEDDEVEKSAEGATASDDAEEIIDDQPEESKDNVQEVAKAVARLLSRGKKAVVKSNPMSELVKVVKSLAQKNQDLEEAIINIYDGMGIADQVKAANEVQKSQRQTPRNDPNEIKKTLDEIKQALGQPVQEKGFFNTPQTLHKSLAENDGEILRGIFTKR